MLNKTEKTSDLMFERFKRNVSEIVTGDGGELELTVEQRKYFLIFKNGDFLVSSCHMKHLSKPYRIMDRIYYQSKKELQCYFSNAPR